MANNRSGVPTRFPSGVNTGSLERFSGRLIIPDKTVVFDHFDDFSLKAVMAGRIRRTSVWGQLRTFCDPA